MAKQKSTSIRFWNKVDKTVGYGPWGNCWQWIGGKSTKQYGCFWYEGRLRGAHIVSYILFHPVQYNPDLEVMHRCDNPSCVRPNHLIQGTHSDNLKDAGRKGRMSFNTKTHCKRGHPLVDGNLYYGKDSRLLSGRRRQCRQCSFLRYHGGL